MARWDRPIGWQLLLWPCLWSLTLAIVYQYSTQSIYFSVWQFIYFIFLFTLGAIAMRGAGCTYNDLVDEDVDQQVDRTRSRPLPSGQISRRTAWLFLFLQVFVGFLVLLQFNRVTIMVGIGSLVWVAIYPFMKRITYWPQAFLGLCFSWGALVGWTAVTGQLTWAPILLYFGSIAWVIGYDTIYAYQDLEDDQKIGVFSTARLFGNQSYWALVVLYAITIVCFSISFFLAKVPLVAMSGLIAAAMHMQKQIEFLDIKNGSQCLQTFKANNMVGIFIFLALCVSWSWLILKPLI